MGSLRLIEKGRCQAMKGCEWSEGLSKRAMALSGEDTTKHLISGEVTAAINIMQWIYE